MEECSASEAPTWQKHAKETMEDFYKKIEKVEGLEESIGQKSRGRSSLSRLCQEFCFAIIDGKVTKVTQGERRAKEAKAICSGDVVGNSIEDQISELARQRAMDHIKHVISVFRQRFLTLVKGNAQFAIK